MREKVILALKGFCMGIADVIPGVSGGTLAIILGIYTQFIESLRSVNLSFVMPLKNAIKGKFSKESRAELIDSLEKMRLFWLINLAVGLVSAIGIGSLIIPSLMERFPEIINALFFGLVLASIAFPIAMMKQRGARELVIATLAAVLAFAMVGGSFTPPISWQKVEARNIEDGGETLKSMARQGPSALKPIEIYQKNEALQEKVGNALPSDLGKTKAGEAAYGELIIPAGTSIEVPKPALWFVFFAGFIAVSAMMLPGISGSFILLIMNTYYFMLNALKGFLSSVIHLQWPGAQLPYIIVFVAGMLGGLILFSRILSWLLRRFPSITLAILSGVMLGCLRTIWPFKIIEGAAATERSNTIPLSSGAEGFCSMADGVEHCWSTGTVVGVGIAFVGGIVLVFALSYAAKRLEGPAKETPAETPAA